MRKWRIEDSEDLYNVKGWGGNYFSINEKGHMVVTPKEGCASVDLPELVDELSLRDVSAPMLIRFPDILDDRINKIDSCFKEAAKEYEFHGQNFVVMPIKVNQMRPVVEEIVSHGKKCNIGLEAGSKPELHAIIALGTDSDSLIVCNGYKDEEFIELALLAQKMGRKIIIVIEKLNELKTTAKIARRLKVTPNLGVRIKLASSGAGKWEESGGDGSKFGLTSSELLEALDFLEEHDMKDCLKLVHYHIGSQVSKIKKINVALREAAQFYVQLHHMGFGFIFQKPCKGHGEHLRHLLRVKGSPVAFQLPQVGPDGPPAVGAHLMHGRKHADLLFLYQQLFHALSDDRLSGRLSGFYGAARKADLPRLGHMASPDLKENLRTALSRHQQDHHRRASPLIPVNPDRCFPAPGPVHPFCNIAHCVYSLSGRFRPLRLDGLSNIPSPGNCSHGNPPGWSPTRPFRCR